MPEEGLSREQVMSELKAYRQEDPDWRDGRVFGYVFHADEEAVETIEQAYHMYLWENALDPSVFKSLLKLETEIVAMAANHVRGDAEVVGNFTSGGTESVLLAVKTARDFARKNKPQIKRPEMILPITAHPCFHKAAHYFDIDVVTVPIDQQTLKADVDAVANAITENTILLVGSATCYAFGVCDPIEALGKLAIEHDLLLHVDGCIGGFVLSLYRQLGVDVPAYDFTVPGVTSMSMDLHKYAFAAKGASVVLYKNKELREHQIFTHSGWTGYTIINPTIQSTKSGGPMAGAWAALKTIGRSGYLEYARGLKEATDRFVAGIEAIDGLHMMGNPEICLVAVGSDTVNIFALCDEMKKRNWHIGPQPGAMGIKESSHMTIMPLNVDQIDDLLVDLAEAVEQVRAYENPAMIEQLKTMAATLDVDNLNDDVVNNMLAMVGVGGGGLPDDMAEINAILDALPAPLVDRLLTAFYNDWNRYKE